MEVAKNFLFEILIIVGMVAIIVAICYGIIELLNFFFKFSKMAIQAAEWKRNKHYIDINYVILDKNGNSVRYTGLKLEEEKAIYEKAIQRVEKVEELQCKFAKKD